MERADLIALCERGAVLESRWKNRDSADAQLQMGEAWSLLRAGCEYVIRPDKDLALPGTVWVEITFKGFPYFDGGDVSKKLFYLPTADRLSPDGADWY